MRELYNKNGVVHMPQALSKQSLELAYAAYEWSLAHPGPGGGNIPSKTTGTFYQDLANPDAFVNYDALIHHYDIRAILESLFIGEHAWFMYEQVFKKEGGETRRTPWHQDTPYLPVRGTDLAVLWISFGSLDLAGTLEFVERSHRDTLYDGSAFDLDDDTLGLYNDPAYPRLPDIEANRDDFNIVAFPVEPGDVVIFHPSVLHGGGPTREHDVRQTLSLRFFGDDAVVVARPGADIPNKSTHPLSQVGRRSDGSPFRHEGFPKIY
ncbi:phytanoyl-CoA dioxygenase family protein [Gammaproteobacteria bacterium]|nr:phytanoyl-CoA dioxygenase family protein [Gammaproteobacteria bacterium]